MRRSPRTLQPTPLEATPRPCPLPPPAGHRGAASAFKRACKPAVAPSVAIGWRGSVPLVRRGRGSRSRNSDDAEERYLERRLLGRSGRDLQRAAEGPLHLGRNIDGELDPARERTLGAHVDGRVSGEHLAPGAQL